MACLTFVLVVATGCSSSEPVPRVDSGPPIVDGATADSRVSDAGVDEVDSGAEPLDADEPVPPDGGVDARRPRPDAGPSRNVTCADPVPAGATVAAPFPTYAGTCPTLEAGPMARNTIMSSGVARRFMLVRPADYDAMRTYPLMFAWHHLGADAEDVFTDGELQRAADELDLVIVVPEKSGLYSVFEQRDFEWPYLETHASGQETEAQFFDDMLACVAAQHSIDVNCVSTTGISAGGLWSSQLMQLRSQRLASAVILSGGTGPATNLGRLIGLDARMWRGAEHKLPVLVLWGGPMDTCALDFNLASLNLGAALDADGHYVMECIHNCRHGIPPVEDQTERLNALWRFAVEHPFWLNDGESINLSPRGMGPGVPTWCSSGAGTAVARTAMCAPDANRCDVPVL